MVSRHGHHHARHDRIGTGTAAGRVGFRLPDCRTLEDALLDEKLRQHPWRQEVYGLDGAQRAAISWRIIPGFLRACVLPLLTDAGDLEK